MPSSLTDYNPTSLVFQQALQRPSALALHCNGVDYSYAVLIQGAQGLASTLTKQLPGHPRVGILGGNSASTFQAILGCCWVGGCYIPLDPNSPAEYLEQCIVQAELDALIVIQVTNSTATVLVQRLRETITVINLPPLTATNAKTQIFDTGMPPLDISADTLIYQLFTSGTSGHPKSVPIAAKNLKQALASLQQLFTIQPNDRLSQTFPLTFDLSVFDIFMTWQHGASLHVIPARQRLAPAKFIQQQQLTCWFSVPSIAILMAKLGQLKSQTFPSLRCSLFCGETLPRALAERWQQAAPQSEIINLYGPSEATIACFSHRYKTQHSTNSSAVAIGTPFEGIGALVLDPQGKKLPQGQAGQLAIAGAQVFGGYWRESEKTKQAFLNIEPDDKGSARWYLTGDKVQQDSSGDWHFLGRIDRQIKVRGIRAELDDIQHHVGACLPDYRIAIIPSLFDQGVCMGLAAIIEVQLSHTPADNQHALQTLGLDRRKLIQQLKTKITTELLPVQWHLTETIPLTAHGKIDYKALSERFSDTVIEKRNTPPASQIKAFAKPSR